MNRDWRDNLFIGIFIILFGLIVCIIYSAAVKSDDPLPIFLFQKDDVKVYRFEDKGKYIYYTVTENKDINVKILDKQ